MFVATIDTGTTNTRVKVWNEDSVIGQASCLVGVRDTAASGSKEKLCQAIHDTLATAAATANMTTDQLELILASGMLTSDVGILEIPHRMAPIGAEALAAGMEEHQIPEVCRQPIWFIPGVRNTSDILEPDQADRMDIMRGEEVEVFGLMARMNLESSAVFVLPGSHTKFVPVDADKRITGCVTTMAGELLTVLSKNTILASAVGHDFSTTFVPEAFGQGVRFYRRLGLGRACFAVRILDQFTAYTVEEKRNCLLGIVLADDMQALRNSHILRQTASAPVVVSGHPVFQQGFQALLTDIYPERKIMVADAHLQQDLAGFGAIVVAKMRGLLPHGIK